MSKLVTLDEQEEYEREVARAHAENRAPALKDPHQVFVENLGNAESHLVEKSSAEQKKDTDDLHKQQKKAQREDKRLQGVIRENIQATKLGEGSNQPYQAPDPSRFNAPSTKEEKEYADRQAEHLVKHGQQFDDSFSDVNIPNLDDEGHVKGDSVNRVFTRKMTTNTPEELVRQNEDNSVPVPERFRTENPPQVIQQSNPVTGEAPTPEVVGYADDFDKVPTTAISVPYPEHVIGDETGTTRNVSRANENDTAKAKNTDPTPTKNVPITERQVFQGAVKSPNTDPVHTLGIPADAQPSNRPEENKAQKVAQQVADELREAEVKDEAERNKLMSERNAEEAKAAEKNGETV